MSIACDSALSHERCYCAVAPILLLPHCVVALTGSYCVVATLCSYLLEFEGEQQQPLPITNALDLRFECSTACERSNVSNPMLRDLRAPTHTQHSHTPSTSTALTQHLRVLLGPKHHRTPWQGARQQQAEWRDRSVFSATTYNPASTARGQCGTVGKPVQCCEWWQPCGHPFAIH